MVIVFVADGLSLTSQRQSISNENDNNTHTQPECYRVKWPIDGTYKGQERPYNGVVPIVSDEMTKFAFIRP